MNTSPLVSIIIANFNGRDRLKECLATVQALDYPQDRVEIIVIDDGSRDGTYEFLEKNFSSIKIFRNNANKGVAKARNIGIRHSRGELLAFVDNDAAVSKDWLLELVKAIELDKDVGICASRILFKHDRGILNSTGGVMNIYGDAWDRGIFEKDVNQYDNHRRVFFACGAAMLVRKDILSKIKHFDPILRLYEDVDLGWRVNLAGYKVIYVPSAIAYHGFGGTIERNGLKGRYLLERNRIRILVKNYEKTTLAKNVIGLLRFKYTRFNKHAISKKRSRAILFILSIAAWLWNIVNILDTINKRRDVQKIRTIPDDGILDLMGNYKYETFNL